MREIFERFEEAIGREAIVEKALYMYVESGETDMTAWFIYYAAVKKYSCRLHIPLAEFQLRLEPNVTPCKVE